MTFEPGDKVTWTDYRITGQSASFTTKEGVVHSTSKTHVVIKKKRGGFISVPMADVRKKGDPSALTEAFKKLNET